MGQLIPLLFKPGINREITHFSNEAGWRDGDRIRFRKGFPETIGGWTSFSSDEFLGTARSLYGWSALDGTTYVGLGSHLKYYILQGVVYNDITPLRATTAAGDVTFSATSTSSTITVSDTGHGALVGDYVTFSGAVSLGGLITADVLNHEYAIASVTDANTYTIEATDTFGGSTVVANASDTGNGGGSVVGAYQISIGLETAVLGTGWGAGPWGEGGWGDASSSSIGLLNLRTWSQDNFGEDLVFNPRDGAVYYWDKTLGLSSRGVLLGDLTGADTPPQVATVTMVSDQDRHVICFGADPFNDLGVQDPLLIRWCDQENIANWTPSTTNTAGSLRISSGSNIISAIQTKREILVFTDVSLHSLQYLGPPFIFGLQELGRTGRLVGPNAAVAVQDSVFWMESGRFMVYDGVIKEVPCTVKEYVFNRVNDNQLSKVYAAHNIRFSEVWWFYPSGTENDSYVVYNYVEDLWFYGSMSRTAWLSSGLLQYPLGASTDNMLYYHEFGQSDGSTNPASSLNPYIESSSTDIQNGDSFVFANRVIPDLTFRDSNSSSPSATLTVKAREYPGETFLQEDDEGVTQSTSSPIEQWTKQVFIRVRGRSFVFRFESNDADVSWRLGIPRIELRTDGRR